MEPGEGFLHLLILSNQFQLTNQASQRAELKQFAMNAVHVSRHLAHPLIYFTFSLHIVINLYAVLFLKSKWIFG